MNNGIADAGGFLNQKLMKKVESTASFIKHREEMKKRKHRSVGEGGNK